MTAPEHLKEVIKLIQANSEATLALTQQLLAEVSENKWTTPEAACAALGQGITPNILKDKVTAGHFTYGREYINTSDGSRPTYAFKVAALRKYFETHPAKRARPSR